MLSRYLPFETQEFKDGHLWLGVDLAVSTKTIHSPDILLQRSFTVSAFPVAYI